MIEVQLLCLRVSIHALGTLSKDVFEPRTSTGSEAFSLFICLDANKLVLLSFFSLLKTIYPRVSTKSFPSDAKSPLPVDVRRPKTLLLKLPIVSISFTRVKCLRRLKVVVPGNRHLSVPFLSPHLASPPSFLLVIPPFSFALLFTSKI